MTAKKKRAHKKYSAAPIRRFRLWQDESSNSDVKIELLPLIDVIFCILTFFLLAAVNFSRQQAINLDLPQARTGSPQMQEDMLLVSIDNIGQLYIEKEQVTKNVLSERVVEYKENNPEGLMVLYASRNTTYREVVEVLDLLKQLGGERVALATIPLGDYVPTVPQIPSSNALPSFPNPPAPPSQ
ncbi:MAG: biopolymer transporter ExbD [Cyanobacteria bacterium P01_F01_bin.143]